MVNSCEELGRIGPIRSGDTQKAGPITILLADDHPLVREGLCALISKQDDMRVVTQAASGRDAIEQYFVHRPRIALLDLRMPAMDGIAVLNAIYERDPACRIVIISSYDNEEDIYRALLAGAKGYILKDAPVQEIIQCVRTVCNGATWIPPLIGAKLARRIGDQDLTSREVDVLHALALGKSNKEIGVIFEISEATVKVHVTHILKKLKVTGRTEAISVAVKRGLVRLDDSSMEHS
jgi:two-component system NarL family response regulator